MDKLLIGIGTWIFSDGIYSWILYHNADSYNGKHQTFLRDHFIRLIRIILAIVLIIMGAL
jgi:hypothetical protein